VRDTLVRDTLVRDTLVRTGTRMVAVIGALTRRDGLRLGAGDPERTARRFALLDATGAGSPTMRAEVAPLLAVLEPLNAQIAEADRRLAALAAADARVQRLMSAPGVGPVTATAFVATLDDVARYRDAHQVMSYLGLVRSERSSGERQHLGHITRAGSPRVRWLLVEAAWRILRIHDADTAPLRAWAERIALRRGERVAVGRARPHSLRDVAGRCRLPPDTRAGEGADVGGGDRLTSPASGAGG
jgi:transposase